MSRNLKLEVILQAVDKATAPLKKAMQSSGELAGAVKEAREQLKKLGAQQEKVAAFKELKAQQREAEAAMQAHNKELSRQAAALKAAQAAAAPQIKQLEEANERMAALRKTSRDTVKEFANQRKELAKTNTAYDKRQVEIEIYQSAFKRAPTAGNKAALDRLINRQAEDLSKIKGLEISLDRLKAAKRDDGREAFKLRAEIGLLKASTGEIIGPLKKLEKDFKEGAKKAKELKVEYSHISENTEKMRRNLNNAGIQTKKLSEQQKNLKERTQQASAALKVQEERLQKLNQQQSRLIAARKRYDKTLEARDRIAGAGAAMGAAGAAMGAPVALSVREYAQAEDAATALRVALMGKGGKTDPAFERINALAEQLGNRLPGTTAELQGMMTMLLRQGMSAQAILGGLGEATAYIGVQLKMPYEEAARFSAQLQDATRTTERDMMGLMDTIQKTYYTGVDPDYMLQGFSKLGAGMDIIRRKGLDGARALAPLLAMANQAGMNDGGSAGNALRKVFQLSMNADKVGKANAAMAGSGIRLDFTDGKGEFGGLPQLFGQLAKLRALSTQSRIAVLKEIYGDDAETLQVLTLMIDKGQAGYDAMQAKLSAQASLQQRVGAQLGTLKNLWDAASGTFTNFLVKLGESIAPELKALTRWLGDLAESASNWAKANPVLAGTLMKVLAVVSAGAIALGALSVAVAAVLGPLALAKLSFAVLGIKAGGLLSVLPAIGQAAMFIGRALLLNPIGLAVTAIALSALAIWKYWGPIKAFFAGLWQGVIAATSTALAWFGALPSRFVTIGSQLMQGMANGIMNGLATVKNAITGAGSAAIGWFKEKLGIHSPSRVFAELGGYTMAGLAVGLNKGAGAPLAAVAATAKRMAGVGLGVSMLAGQAAAVPLDARAPLAAGSAAAPITITIHAAPGMDERALARLVAAEVDKAQRQQAARGRARLTDRE